MSRVAPIAPAPAEPLAAQRFGPAGEPAPPVLLLHGRPGQASVWRQVGDQLHAHGVYALALDHHGIDQVTVLAHSWASGAAIALAVGFPERVASMVLLDPIAAKRMAGSARRSSNAPWWSSSRSCAARCIDSMCPPGARSLVPSSRWSTPA